MVLFVLSSCLEELGTGHHSVPRYLSVGGSEISSEEKSLPSAMS